MTKTVGAKKKKFLKNNTCKENTLSRKSRQLKTSKLLMATTPLIKKAWKKARRADVVEEQMKNLQHREQYKLNENVSEKQNTL